MERPLLVLIIMALCAFGSDIAGGGIMGGDLAGGDFASGDFAGVGQNHNKRNLAILAQNSAPTYKDSAHYDKLDKNYIFWVQIGTHNHTTYHQTISISQAMYAKNQCKQCYKSALACAIALSSDDIARLNAATSILSAKDALYSTIYAHRDEIFDCLDLGEIKINDTLSVSNDNTNANTALSILPIGFSVELGDELLVFK